MALKFDQTEARGGVEATADAHVEKFKNITSVANVSNVSPLCENMYHDERGDKGVVPLCI